MGQNPARRHRILRVERQIENCRFELRGIGEGQNQPLVQQRADLNIFPQCATQQDAHSLNQLIAVDRRGPKFLPSAESQQPARQIRAAHAGSHDGVAILLQIGPCLEFLSDNIRELPE